MCFFVKVAFISFTSLISDTGLSYFSLSGLVCRTEPLFTVVSSQDILRGSAGLQHHDLRETTTISSSEFGFWGRRYGLCNPERDIEGDAMECADRWIRSFGVVRHWLEGDDCKPSLLRPEKGSLHPAPQACVVPDGGGECKKYTLQSLPRCWRHSWRGSHPRLSYFRRNSVRWWMHPRDEHLEEIDTLGSWSFLQPRIPTLAWF